VVQASSLGAFTIRLRCRLGGYRSPAPGNLQPRLAETIDQLLDELRSPPLLEFLARYCGKIRFNASSFRAALWAASTSPSCPYTAANATFVRQKPGMLSLSATSSAPG